MSDLIDRQAAIDAHYEYCNKHPDASFPVWSLKILENLPSAQPEPSKTARDIATIIENEKDMRVISKNEPLKTDQKAPFDEFISRKAAIDAIMDADVCVTWNGVISDDDAVDIAIKSTKGSVISSIVNMPSAQPELPEWAQKVEEYRKSAPSFVRNQLVWALYQTWKEYDGRLVHQRGKENR